MQPVEVEDVMQPVEVEDVITQINMVDFDEVEDNLYAADIGGMLVIVVPEPNRFIDESAKHHTVAKTHGFTSICVMDDDVEIRGQVFLGQRKRQR